MPGAHGTSACAAFCSEWSKSALGTCWDQGFQNPPHRHDGWRQIREQMGLERAMAERAMAGFCDLPRKHWRVKMPSERKFCQWFEPSLKWLLNSAGLEGFLPSLENSQCFEASYVLPATAEPNTIFHPPKNKQWGRDRKPADHVVKRIATFFTGEKMIMVNCVGVASTWLMIHYCSTAGRQTLRASRRDKSTAS